MPLSPSLALVGFLAASVVAASSGVVFRPPPWYRSIAKPRWTPPNWVFPAVWTPLYGLIALSGWLVWRHGGLAPLPFGFFAAQLVFNALWSALFFGLRRPDLAFVDLVLLWLSILATLVSFASIDGVAAVLLVPYLAWVTVAGALNVEVWRRNPTPLRAI
ncbi:tryptophan-rich sensory protein [Lichenihabitans sp. Uapishka_5]|uniref:TspO/MBR family protein n=1 Tax=Lichenihabitans sp. Uapishka_5 TaxID=3037302 RepID=UPI0029E8012E|nr:TspO/MBR family protein [Lichenihabitans sp. Uapishka_5]MDX7953727.1 tryptophan-rich sensory protein [Lichenihabitans sp. Uapishka_5]